MKVTVGFRTEKIESGQLEAIMKTILEQGIEDVEISIRFK